MPNMCLKYMPVSEFVVAVDGSFSGYGAAYGNVDRHGEIIVSGAFSKSLEEHRRRSTMPHMLLQHGGGFLSGGVDMVPVGIWDTAESDEKGLLMSGHLIGMDLERGKVVYDAMKSGALYGLSVGFITSKAKSIGGVLNIVEAELIEVSIVTVPANPEATVTNVKGMPSTVREFETFLRSSGFSQAASKGIASQGFKSGNHRDGGAGVSRLLVALNDLQAKFKQ